MASPSSAITRLDLSLTFQELNLMANQKKFIGLSVLPVLAVAEEAATFPKINIESLMGKVEDTRRNADGTYARGDYEWGSDSYALTEHGVEEPVDDAKVERYGDIVRVEAISEARAIYRVLQRLEYDIAAAVFDTTVWTGAALTTAATAAWTTHASGVPHADVMAAHQKVEDGCGETANTLVMSSKAYRNLLQCDEITGLLKYDATDVLLNAYQTLDQKAVREAAAGLRTLFQVDQILVGRALQNSSDQGQDASFASFWNTTLAMLCVVNNDGPGGDLESIQPQIGRTLFSSKNNEPIPGDDSDGLGSLIVEEYREEQRRGSVIRPRNKRQIKILHAAAGHLINTVTA